MQLLPGNIELSNNPFEKPIWIHLKSLLKDEEGVLGYKIPSLGTKNVEDIPSFIIRSKRYGIVVIDVVPNKISQIDETSEYWINPGGDDIYSRDIIVSNYCKDINNKLSKSTTLFNNKDKKFTIEGDFVHPLLIFPNNTPQEILNIDINETIVNKYIGSNYVNTLQSFFNSCKNNKITYDQIDEIDSRLEGTAVFNKKRGRISTNEETRNDLIRKSLLETFKLDSTQRSIALQVPNGPQRIRGLAGTGKTIILSMKAALTHIYNKEFKILFVFNTQSMYNQIIDNIEKYTIEESSSTPNWDSLKVMHAWGGKKREGLYSYLCAEYGEIPKVLYETKNQSDPYQYIYSDFLHKRKNQIKPIFDMVLIDEAQDFPPAFFETIYHITKPPKRIIWAYDEFQSLNELKIAEPEKLFGVDDNGQVNLANTCIEGEYEGGIEKDYMLPNSYRNPRKVLMYAHGLGLGLYSKNAKVPMQDRYSWEARGYKIIQPPQKTTFKHNDEIIVERPETASKNILERLIAASSRFTSEKIISYKHHETLDAELRYVINGIKKLIAKDKIEPEEIIVISLDKHNAKGHFAFIRSELNASNIQCITPGFIENADLFKEKGRVTLTTPFRAKGNEANIVFVINSQKAISDVTLRERNALFVSITRARGWCFMSGNGLESISLKAEIDQIEKDYPQFKFIFPSESDYSRRMRLISESDKSLSKKEKSVDAILKEEAALALLIEKAKEDPDIFNKIKKMMGND